jgi:hypothetical protein
MAVYRHLFIDELQDLVGDRADFVSVILEAIGGGFTLFGDPAQGIYDFQLSDHERRAENIPMHFKVIRQFPNQLRLITLSGNHRAKTEEARVALKYGEQLTGSSPDYERLYRELNDVIRSLSSVGRLDSIGRHLVDAKEQTCILCRNNGQALMISRELWKQNCFHKLQRAATDRWLPDWIAILLQEIEVASIDKADFLTLADGKELAADSSATWKSLKRAEGARGDSLDLRKLGKNFRRGIIPDPLNFADAGHALTVSSIHRAKGLQFERVLLARQKEEGANVEFVAEEARTLFVALTRSQSLLKAVDVPQFRGLRKSETSDRWIRAFDWKLADIEVRPTDVDVTEPFWPRGSCVSEIQASLRELVPGAPLTLRRSGSDQNPNAVYTVHCGETPIARTHQRFA